MNDQEAYDFKSMETEITAQRMEITNLRIRLEAAHTRKKIWAWAAFVLGLCMAGGKAWVG